MAGGKQWQRGVSAMWGAVTAPQTKAPPRRFVPRVWGTGSLEESSGKVNQVVGVWTSCIPLPAVLCSAGDSPVFVDTAPVHTVGVKCILLHREFEQMPFLGCPSGRDVTLLDREGDRHLLKVSGVCSQSSD